MKTILAQELLPEEAALWWLGQAGYVIRSAGLTIAIDPYLSDAAGRGSPEFSRQYPPPVAAEELEADIYIITHDHLDHLDPETIASLRNKGSARFVAPRLAARKLPALGVPAEQTIVLNAGETWRTEGVEITGVFALPTGADVLDTTGYIVTFGNGRSVYHTSDTQFHPLVLAAAPHAPDLMLVPINGKWNNPGPEQAAEFAKAVRPRFVMPNHYDMMALNAENPAVFKWCCEQQGLGSNCVIAERMQSFIWS
ncbi:MBL fold metallo-hydrolase [Chitinophaga sp.]|uniref:MBL fold metallo-hydrolase n=1 Tax=Chitinophaga sp. TaxID=1869181 RepID=UPI0031D2B70C